jgi:hypothetical protein
MNSEKPAGQNQHLGKKILYGVVIALCVLVIVVNAALIIGVWAVEQPLSELAVATLQFVENTASVMQTYTASVDEVLENLQARTTVITVAAGRLGQSVADQGLILTLLPEEREQELGESTDSVRGTFGGVRESISRGVELYRAINRLPFVSLPTLDQDPVEELATSVDETRSGAEALRLSIAEYRSGQAEKIEKVEEAAAALGERIQRARDRVAMVDNRMAALEAGAVALQSKVVVVLATTAAILTLLLAFVIWTQVEMIRQYTERWGRLGQTQIPEPAAAKPSLPAVATAEMAVGGPKPAEKAQQPTKKAAAAPKKKTRAAAKKKK